MNTLIIVLCSMLLLAYLGEISSQRTRIPTVILLLFLGWLARLGSDLLMLNIPDLYPLLPFLGTIGLILIVLEASLELKLNRSKIPVVRRSFMLAILPLILISVVLGLAFARYASVPFHQGLVNALPFAVVSSSIAIPSARNMTYSNKEFIIYESSLSDILGVLFFNFFIANQLIDFTSVGLFILQIILISLISVFSVMGLSYILGRVNNHITYTPIIVLVILIYAVAKEFNLSGLVFILIFGLFLGNIDQVRRFSPLEKLMELIDTKQLAGEVHKFKLITVEATFLVRSLFFLMFGYIMETHEFLNLQTLPWAVGIVALILLSRWLFLKILKLPVATLLPVSPRGLITILLFLSVSPGLNISFVNNSLVIQVIILSVVAMLIGFLFFNRNKEIKA